MNSKLISKLILLLLVTAAANLRGVEAALPYAINTGEHSNNGTAETNAFSRVVFYPGVHPLRVHFAEANLGERSYVRLTGLKDRQVQTLNGTGLKNWNSASAMFNGDAVLMELIVAPGESGIFALMDKIVLTPLSDAPFPAASEKDGNSMTKSLCGDDDRVASSDNRVGRINGCTAWLISNRAVLT